jgi:membrane associated rhomboid family serine protease
MSYYQNNRYQNNSFFGNIPVVTRNILLINLIVWLLCYLSPGIAQFLALYDVQSGYFNLYQLVTYMFTHIEFWHLFANMFGLFIFGATLENYWGQKRFLTYYLVTGIGAGLIQLLVGYLQSSYSVTIGASGSIFGILLAFGLLFPNVSMFIIPIPVPVKAKYLVLGYGLLELYSGFANHSGDPIAHFAHLGGMLFGIFLILYWKKKGDFYGKKQWPSIWNKVTAFFKKKPRKMKVTKRPESDWEYNSRRAEESKEVDKILDKIKYSGYESLSEEEKRKLFNAGKK